MYGTITSVGVGHGAPLNSLVGIKNTSFGAHLTRISDDLAMVAYYSAIKTSKPTKCVDSIR